MKRVVALSMLCLFGCSFFLAACFKKKENHPSLTSKSVVQLLQKTADWQMQCFKYLENGSPGALHDYGVDAWTNATLYLGMLKWAQIAPDHRPLRWVKELCARHNYQMPQNFVDYPKIGLHHADELCIAQVYLKLYANHNVAEALPPVVDRIDQMMQQQVDLSMRYWNKQQWSWCDALFMAPQVYAQLGTITANNSYVDHMHNLYQLSYIHLFDQQEDLFFRDDSFFEKREANGRKVFWGRGNGWVLAGLANLLDCLPEEDSHRTFYIELYKRLTDRLVGLQGESGFWHASLLDPDSYPAPETSATALICYALAYGVNHGILPDKIYRPIVERTWRALASAVHPDGKLGYVQPIGADPRKVTVEMSAVYGVGAFLLAGSEVYKMLECN